MSWRKSLVKSWFEKLSPAVRHRHPNEVGRPDGPPENNGALDANATPKHKGSVTRNTTKPAVRSRDTVADNELFVGVMEVSDAFRS
ncbi:MAG: hypothetical protein ACRERU_13195, partial [Methylococcales bacterium]